jgi:LAO/AO transport system kinase
MSPFPNKGLASRILKGDIRAASMLMRDIDDRVPAALEELKKLYPHSGKAHIIGITGPPGCGKSTIIDKIVDIFRKEGKSVGIVAVDATSPFTGGAILGDRIRMQRHATDKGVFIRSLATRGRLGGLSCSTQDTVNVMDAMGKELILVETVGVGQDEVEIVHACHTSIVVLVPGLGDDIQVIKAGVVEIGDIFVINKCERQGADKLEKDIRMAIETGHHNMSTSKVDNGWKPSIFKTDALSGKGISELVRGISLHRQVLKQSKVLEKKLRERAKASFLNVLEIEVTAYLVEKMKKKGQWDTIIKDLMNRRIDPYSIAKKIMAEELKK